MPNIGYGSAKKTKHMLPNGGPSHLPRLLTEWRTAEGAAERCCIRIRRNRWSQWSRARSGIRGRCVLAAILRSQIPVSAGFLKFIVHNVDDLNLLLMHNRCASSFSESTLGESTFRLVISSVRCLTVFNVSYYACSKYCAEVASNVSTLTRKSIVERAQQVRLFFVCDDAC